MFGDSHFQIHTRICAQAPRPALTRCLHAGKKLRSGVTLAAGSLGQRAGLMLRVRPKNGGAIPGIRIIQTLGENFGTLLEGDV